MLYSVHELEYYLCVQFTHINVFSKYYNNSSDLLKRGARPIRYKNCREEIILSRVVFFFFSFSVTGTPLFLTETLKTT